MWHCVQCWIQGDEVLIPQPSYVSYVPCTILADGNPVVIPLQEKNRIQADGRRTGSSDHTEDKDAGNAVPK